MSVIASSAIAVPRAAIEGIVEPRSAEMGITYSPGQAATRIQALMRGVLSRGSLPQQFYFEQQYNKLMRTTGEVEHTEATAGNTPVWFPKACPGIIMKFSNSFSHLRLVAMNSIREALETQGSSHAIVPRAKICE